MNAYQKINTIFKRDIKGRILENNWSLPELDYLKNNYWRVEEKFHGTNIRVIYDTEKLEFKGRTDRAVLQPIVSEMLKTTFDRIDLFKEKFGSIPVCIYGEAIGHKIQEMGDLYNKTGNEFILFDIKIGSTWVSRDELETTSKYLRVKIAPVYGYYTIPETIELIKTGLKSNQGDFLSEGVVLKLPVELNDNRGNRIITKLKHKDFI